MAGLEPEGPYLGGFEGRRAYKTIKTPSRPRSRSQTLFRCRSDGSDLGNSHVTVAILRRGDLAAGDWSPCLGDCGISAVGLESVVAIRGRLGAPEEAGPASSQPGARRCNIAHHVANGWHPTRDRGTGSSNCETWNPIVFSGLQLCMRIPVRPPPPGRHSGRADSYAGFRLMK